MASATRDIEALGGRAVPIKADIANAEAVRAAADRVERERGPVDVWVDNAMIAAYATCAAVTPEEVLQVAPITCLGQVPGTLRRWRT